MTRHGSSVARLVVALVSFVPFAPGLLTGGSFFYRDLSYQFFPIRRFVVEGLLRGELRRWNPFMNEGTPLALPPLAYPIDWLQALVPNEWGFSLLLALHVPIAALTFLELGRRLGHGPLAATLGALVYALSGFSLSSVNLYLHVEAFAWAPLVISMLIRASTGGAREIAVAGAAVALCLSTIGVEIAAQALACGFVLAASRSALGHLRLAAAIALAATTAVIAADLLRAGAGLNPTTHSSFYALSPEMSQVAARLRETGGRAFTCSIYGMPTFRDAVRRVGRPDLWTASVWRESLSPFTNMDAGIATTGVDPTALVSSARSLSQADAMCRDAGTPQRLRASGVRYILSVQPFTNEALRTAYVASPARTAPLSVHVYELQGALPDPTLWLGPDDVDEHGRGRALETGVARYVSSQPDLVRVSVETPQAAYLILRRTHARGWSASLGGKPAEIVTANGRHQAIAVPAGQSEVVLSYHAPNAGLGLALSLLSAALAAGLWIRSSPGDKPTAEGHA